MSGTRPSARIGIDVGGTFTDLVLHDEVRGLTWTGKLLTTPAAPGVAIVAGVERLLRESGTDIAAVSGIVHGTTLITNTVLERNGAKVGLITTEGFRDTLEMGREIRFAVDDLYARPAEVLVPRRRRLGVPGRMRADGTEYEPLDKASLLAAAETLIEVEQVEALAVSFLHGYANPRHEIEARELIIAAFPDVLVTLSSEVASEMREYERTSTACLNAYVQPKVHGYLDRLEADLRNIGFGGSLHIMLSSGGITTIAEAKAFPVRLLESGPAAGAMAASFIARAAGEAKVVSFDMGGTTAKMCLVDGGRPRIKHEFEAGRVEKFKPGSGLPVKITVVDMIEIGSGGGTMASLDSTGLLQVGPRSAGSVPGPVAYGVGGTIPTVTDADLLVGYLDPENFLGGELELAADSVVNAVEDVLGRPLGLDSTTVAAGIEESVTENMAAATRMHLAERGHDPRDYTLIAFGGAGPVHAYPLAKALGIQRVLVPMAAGVISAFGFLVAPPKTDDVRTYVAPLREIDWGQVKGLYDEMAARALALLSEAGVERGEVSTVRTADMRYLGQGFEIEVPIPAQPFDTGLGDVLRREFLRAYEAVFGHVVDGAEPEVVNWRMAACGEESDISLAYTLVDTAAERRKRNVWFGDAGTLLAPVYDRYALAVGTKIRGPAVFEERESSCSVGPDCWVTVDSRYNLIVDIDDGGEP